MKKPYNFRLDQDLKTDAIKYLKSNESLTEYIHKSIKSMNKKRQSEVLGIYELDFEFMYESEKVKCKVFFEYEDNHLTIINILYKDNDMLEMLELLGHINDFEKQFNTYVQECIKVGKEEAASDLYDLIKGR